jgi:dephospho-CoA kinase
MMFQVGLTGGIGSGKSLVCSVLEKLGAPVYYADSQARMLMASDPELIRKIIELFGEEAYLANTLNRGYLARRVFGNAEMLSRLNALVHPAVRRDYEGWVTKQQDVPYVVEEAAILFESGAHRRLDRTVLVYAPEDLRISRVMKRDGVDEDHVRQRMRHQMDEEEKRNLADMVIMNDESEMLLPQIIEVHTEILKSRH